MHDVSSIKIINGENVVLCGFYFLQLTDLFCIKIGRYKVFM